MPSASTSSDYRRLDHLPAHCSRTGYCRTSDPSSDNYREYDAEDHRQPAVETHSCTGGLLPSPYRPTDRDAEQRQQANSYQGNFHENKTRSVR